jgi:Ternary complex associated domain 9
VDLEIHLPHEEDADLVLGCVEYLNPAATVASVRPLGRYGYTESRLYLVYCAPNNAGIPFVVKTDRPEIIRNEAGGVRKLSVYFAGAQSARIYPEGEEPQAIIYPLVAVDGQERVQELREIVYQPAGSREGLPTPTELLQRTYQSCRSAHITGPGSFAFGEEYRSYLRDTGERLLTDPLPALFADRSSVNIYGYTLNDPRRILERVKAWEIASRVCPVHGDLHPNNVLFGPEFSPVLIDYAFGHLDGHFVKDFVLMECSLRFLLPPKLLQPDLIVEFDQYLLEENGYEAVGEFPARGRTGDVIREMASLIEVIRQQCRACVPDYKFKEYLIAQYMVLLGNIRLLPYQDFRMLLALCRLADYLDSEPLT